MPDWLREAWRKLAGSKFSAEERDDVSRELAGYLDDLCSEARSSGADEASSVARGTRELNEDPRLGAHLYRARQEGSMNDRTKQLWLPGITLMFVAALTLELFQLAALWTYRVYVAAPHGHDFFWLGRYKSATLFVYFAWLYVLPFLGAAGAWWSRRAGSGRAKQLASGLFPLVLLLAIFCRELALILAVGPHPFQLDLLPPAHAFFAFLPSSYSLFLSWVVMPGAALLLGVVPFLLSSRVTANRSHGMNSAISAH